MKLGRQLNFHCTQKNNNARVLTNIWVCSPGWGLHHINSFPSSIWLWRFRQHARSGLLLVAGKLRYDLHSPFCDSIHGLYLLGDGLPAKLDAPESSEEKVIHNLFK